MNFVEPHGHENGFLSYAAPRFPAEIYTGTEFANKSAVKTTKSKKVGAAVCVL
jgi:hypothetical protein